MPRKNLRPFGPFEHGLIQIKLGQLLECSLIDRIVLSTNDEEILSFAEGFNSQRLIIHHRDDYLSTSETSTDELVDHACELVGHGHVLWTHVTSPFVSAKVYSRIVEAYRRALRNGYDSLMTVTRLQGFIWNETGPVNYDRTVEKWPRTQTLTPLHEINSAAFLAPIDIYDLQRDRIGTAPFLHDLDRLTAWDIDWEEDFILAEQLLLNRLAST